MTPNNMENLKVKVKNLKQQDKAEKILFSLKNLRFAQNLDSCGMKLSRHCGIPPPKGGD
jgi:hypothetical protein